MSDIVSLELVYDDDADAAIRAEWDALAAADLPSQARHTGESNRPHTTLLVRPALPDFDGALLAETLPVTMTLGAPVLFGAGRSRVIARSVVPSAALLHLHARVHDLAGEGDDADHTRPGAWTPHVTLARRVPLDRVGDALRVLADAAPLERRVKAVGIRRWETATKTVTEVVARGTLEGC